MTGKLSFLYFLTKNMSVRLCSVIKLKESMCRFDFPNYPPPTNSLIYIYIASTVVIVPIQFKLVGLKSCWISMEPILADKSALLRFQHD